MSDKTYTARGDGYVVTIQESPSGVMFSVEATGVNIREMHRDWTPQDVVTYIQNMLPVEIDLQRGIVRDTSI